MGYAINKVGREMMMGSMHEVVNDWSLHSQVYMFTGILSLTTVCVSSKSVSLSAPGIPLE